MRTLYSTLYYCVGCCLSSLEFLFVPYICFTACWFERCVRVQHFVSAVNLSVVG